MLEWIFREEYNAKLNVKVITESQEECHIFG